MDLAFESSERQHPQPLAREPRQLELGIPTLPTPADPRQFFLAWGFALGRWSGTAGIANFSTLGFGRDGVGATATWPGVYGDIAVRVTERFDIRVMVVLSTPVMMSLGFGWRFAR